MQINKIDPDQAARYFRKRGEVDLADYIAMLSQLEPGDAGVIRDFQPLTIRATKRRIGLAARQLKCGIKWARASDTDVLRFQLRAGTTARRRQVSQRRQTPDKRQTHRSTK